MSGAQEQTKNGIRKLSISKMIFCPVTGEYRDVTMDCRGCKCLVDIHRFEVLCEPDKKET